MILVTGFNGFLGRIVIKELEQNNQISTLSRNSGDYKVFLEKEVPNFKTAFDMVIHAAGKAHVVPKTMAEKSKFHEVNVVGTKNLLEGLRKVDTPKCFVFISSVSVYGQEFGSNINEEHPLEAKDPYGLSKIKGEQLVADWCLKNGVICTILRLPLLVGENPGGNLGAMVKGIEKGYYFNIGGGNARKSMVLAEDIAQFIPKIASIGGIYNLTDGVHPSFYELSKIISKMKGKKQPLNLSMPIAKIIGLVGDLLGSNAPLNSLKLRKISSDLTFDDSRARIVANWKPRTVLEWYEP